MRDRDILKWLEGHYSKFRETLQQNENGISFYELEWIADDGHSFSVQGISLKECVAKAINSVDIKAI